MDETYVESPGSRPADRLVAADVLLREEPDEEEDEDEEEHQGDEDDDDGDEGYSEGTCSGCCKISITLKTSGQSLASLLARPVDNRKELPVIHPECEGSERTNRPVPSQRTLSTRTSSAKRDSHKRNPHSRPIHAVEHRIKAARAATGVSGMVLDREIVPYMRTRDSAPGKNNPGYYRRLRWKCERSS